METLQSAVNLYVPFYMVTWTDKFSHDNKWHKYPHYIFGKPSLIRNVYGDYMTKVLTTLNFTVDIKLHMTNVVEVCETI